MQTRARLSDRLITRIQVRKLFGEFDYDLRLSDEAESSLFAIYGDNGTGKSTLLQLTWHLLDPTPRQNHRTYISTIPFEYFDVQFGDGARVFASRGESDIVGSFEMGIELSNGVTFRREYKQTSIGKIHYGPEQVEEIASDRAFLSQLELVSPSVHWLPEDRKNKTFDTDELGAVYVDEMGRRRHIQRTTALDDALSRLYASIRNRALEASNAGVAHVNTVYAKIVRDVASPLDRGEQGLIDLGELIDALEVETQRSDAFETLGLVSSGGLNDVIAALRIADEGRAQILARVIVPFLDGLRARLDALQDVYDTVRTLLDALSQFYTNKGISYNLSRGLTIRTRSGSVLPVDQLSSGEQQLMLLLCDIAAAQDRSSLFIIDEPELSLNITWQRDLISAFRAFARSGKTQFVLATHSLELISRYRDNVAFLTE